MTERERLIELLIEWGNKEDDGMRAESLADYLIANGIAENIADYLLAKGVIVLPCNVGDTVYILAGTNGHKYEKDTCEGFYIGDDGVVQVRVRNMKGNHGTYGVMGETVFLTREEAEQALKEERNHD